MIPIFAYFISLVVLANPAAASALTSDAYSAIFTSPDEELFVQSVNQYFDETLQDTTTAPLQTVTPTSGETPITYEPLDNNYYIEHTYSASGAISSIQLFVLYAYYSDIKIDFIKDGSTWESKTVTISGSSYQTITLTTPISGTFSIRITHTNSNTGNQIPLFDQNSITTLPGTSVSSTSTYYRKYITYTQEPCMASTAILIEPWPVIMITEEGILLSLMYLRIDMPGISGSSRSSKTTSGGLFLISTRPAPPLSTCLAL